jgi:predicted negative regulator of RcsB-dependent stress response
VNVYLTEQQQIEEIKKWWQRNGTSTIIIFVLVICASIGWRFWLQHRETKLERASTHYEELLNAVVNDDAIDAQKEANLLRHNYLHTPYAALASLMLARGDVYQGNYDSAKQQLTWVMKHANTNALREIARLRLARITLLQNQPKDALQLLAKVDDKNYEPLINELIGDSYLALNQIDNARSAYQRAITELPDPAMRPILQMKLDDIAANPTMTVK